MTTAANTTRLYLAQKGRCFHCLLPMLMGSVRKKASGAYNQGWTQEHLVPKSKGGKKGSNIVLAHIRCNGKRGNADPTAAMLHRARLIWAEARSLDNKECGRIANDTVLRDTYMAAYDFRQYEMSANEPQFIPPECPAP